MTEQEQLHNALKQFWSNDSDLFAATVNAVNGEVIDVTAMDGTEYPDVQLKASINSQGGMIIKPIVGSTVLVGRIDKSNRLFVAMFSEIEEIVFNRGENGMVKIDKLTDKLNELVKAFNDHTHEIGPGGIKTEGSATIQTTKVPVTVPSVKAKAQQLKKEDYEDIKIKH